MYKYDKVGGEYVLSEDNQPVLTPGGNAFSTAYEDLAALLCNDLNEYGPNPFDSSSYVTLHTSYTDFGYAVEKSELIANIILGYTPEWDIAIAQLSAFNRQFTSPLAPTTPAKTGINLDPVLFWGPLVETSVIQTWLENLSLRTLCSIQVCGASFQSVHVGYALLQEDHPWPIISLAQGIIAYSETIPTSLTVNNNQQATEQRVIGFLGKIKTYANIPDERF